VTHLFVSYCHCRRARYCCYRVLVRVMLVHACSDLIYKPQIIFSPLGRGFLTGQIKRPEDIPGNSTDLRHLSVMLTKSDRGRFPPLIASFPGGCKFPGMCLIIPHHSCIELQTQLCHCRCVDRNCREQERNLCST
jgi:hypothetical protein